VALGVGDSRKKTKVGVAVSVGVRVGVGVSVGAIVGGAARAVWVLAAAAVSTMAVSGEFGSNVGMGCGAGAKTGAHASISAMITPVVRVLYLRWIIPSTSI